MYWWNVSKLAEDFREGRVEEKERLKYFLAATIVWGIAAEPLFWYHHTFRLAVNAITAVVGRTTTILGTVLCYRANKSGDNTDFIGRMICLGWPICIKLLVLFVPIMVIVDLGALAIGSDFEVIKDETIIGVIWGVAALICAYWLLYKYVRLVAQAKALKCHD
jgi:hypothetical protein